MGQCPHALSGELNPSKSVVYMTLQEFVYINYDVFVIVSGPLKQAKLRMDQSPDAYQCDLNP